MSKLPTPLNGHVLVDPIVDQVKSVFSNPDSKKDLQYAKVLAVAEGSLLKVNDTIVYNPRSLNAINLEGVGLKGFVHEGIIIAIL